MERKIQDAVDKAFFYVILGIRGHSLLSRKRDVRIRDYSVIVEQGCCNTLSFDFRRIAHRWYTYTTFYYAIEFVFCL